jgi:hypothetical protein
VIVVLKRRGIPRRGRWHRIETRAGVHIFCGVSTDVWRPLLCKHRARHKIHGGIRLWQQSARHDILGCTRNGQTVICCITVARHARFMKPMSIVEGRMNTCHVGFGSTRRVLKRCVTDARRMGLSTVRPIVRKRVGRSVQGLRIAIKRRRSGMRCRRLVYTLLLFCL